MADITTIEINKLPSMNGVQLSDRIHIYTLSGGDYIQSVHQLAELSNFIFSGEQMDEVKAKYNSLVSTFESFKDWMNNNYFTKNLASAQITTSAYFKEVYDSVYSVDKVKEDYMNEYATPQDLENLKAAIYAYIENVALGYGGHRIGILNSISYQKLLADGDGNLEVESASDSSVDYSGDDPGSSDDYRSYSDDSGGSSSGTAKHTAPTISKKYYQFWYGCVNCWSSKVNGKYPFEAQISKLRSVNCTGYHIEMFAWKGGSNTMSNIKTAYEKLIKLCRKNKMWLFVDVINGNFNGSKTKWTAGMSDYSKLTVGYIVKNYGQKLIDIIKDNGPQNVIIQPIGEPGSKGQNSDCHKFQDMCCNQLKDFILVTEPSRSNSSKLKKAYRYSVKHVQNKVPKNLDENEKLKKGVNDGAGDWESADGCNIVVTDSGPAIQALASPEEGSQQGWLNKWTSACSRASRLVNAVKTYKGKCAVFVYYAFKFKCMGTNGSTVDGELNKGTWNNIKNFVSPKYP